MCCQSTAEINRGSCRKVNGPDGQPAKFVTRIYFITCTSTFCGAGCMVQHVFTVNNLEQETLLCEM
jgi:hypothetical protein